MAADGISPALAIRSSVGVELWHTTDSHKTYTPSEQFSKDESKFCRAIAYSPDGRFLAWANGSKVQIASVDTWKVICSLPRPKALSIKFSPKGTYLATLEHFSSAKDGGEPQPNYNVYNARTGDPVYGIISKTSVDGWEPHWSGDEAIYALMIGGEAFFFETQSESGYTKPANKIGGSRGGELSIAGSGNNPHVALYVRGVKGQPSMVKIFRYPALEANQVVAAKSFFQADRVEMRWNKRATGLLVLASTEVDSTGASYYGNQTLHYLSTKGDTCTVPLNKEGPIHAVEWSPKGNEFCVVFGYMPAKATFFNLKCDAVFEVEDAPRNAIYYNPFGSIVLLAGFGNLRGNVQVWDVKKKKKITEFQASDSTMLQWGPDGEHILTATTAPRLRIGNGFKVWHYSGALLHEHHWAAGQELFEVNWQNYAESVFAEQPISDKKVAGIESSQPVSSKAAYVPPNIRSGAAAPVPGSSPRGPIPGLPIGYRTSQAQKKKERKAKANANAPNDKLDKSTASDQSLDKSLNKSTLSDKSLNKSTSSDKSTASPDKPTTNKKQNNQRKPNAANAGAAKPNDGKPQPNNVPKAAAGDADHSNHSEIISQIGGLNIDVQPPTAAE